MGNSINEAYEKLEKARAFAPAVALDSTGKCSDARARSPADRRRYVWQGIQGSGQEQWPPCRPEEDSPRGELSGPLPVRWIRL